MAANAKRTGDKSARVVLDHLKARYGLHHPDAQIEVYRYNPASIRIRIIDRAFKGMDWLERDNLISPILDELPEEIHSDIMLLVLITPKERESSPASLEFDHPAARTS